MCYYVGDIIKFQNFNSDNISIDEKPHENISIFDISYEKKIGAKPMRIWFSKIDGFITVYDGHRY